MEAVLIIAITMLMGGGTGLGFMDLELRVPQKDMIVCKEAKRNVRTRTHTNNREYGDEYKFIIRGMWCMSVDERRR